MDKVFNVFKCSFEKRGNLIYITATVINIDTEVSVKNLNLHNFIKIEIFAYS